MLIVLAFGMLIGFGAAALISIRLGERKKAEAEADPRQRGRAAGRRLAGDHGAGTAVSRRYSAVLRGQR